MTTEREPGTRIVLSWLREDQHENAERVLLRALDEVDTTPQRRSWWPAWRFEKMRTTQILVAAAAVLVVAFLGYNLLPGLSGPGQTTPPVAPTATAAASPSNPPVLTGGALDAGTYTVASFTNMDFTVTVPAGWRGDDNFIVKGEGTAAEEAFEGDGVTLARWQISHVYADACDWEGTLQEVTSAAEIVTALDDQGGHEASEPADAALGGEAATRIDLSLDAAFDVETCDGSFVRLWPDAGPDERFGLPIYPGQTSRVYVVDHGTNATMIIAITNEASDPADVAELEEVLASVEFQP